MVLLKIAENFRLRSQLDAANEEIKRLRARLESSELDLMKLRSANNLSNVADLSSGDDLNGLNQRFNRYRNKGLYLIMVTFHHVQGRTLLC
jgi:hypothetical protein